MDIVFRNDDVRETLDASLIEVTEVFMRRGVPITHAVEPANVTSEVTEWLLDMQRRHPGKVEIMQHGYDHRIKNRRQKGEFGGQRTYAEQHADIQAGQALMDRHFGSAWFRCFNFPFAPYNPAAIRALDDLQYRVLNSHYNAHWSRRLFYVVGHALRRGYLFGHHVSWHLRRYPGTQLFEIDMCISFIDRYLNDQSDCIFYPLEDLLEETRRYRHLPVIGLLLHHRYHTTRDKVALVEQYLDWALAQGYDFKTFETVYKERAPRIGLTASSGRMAP